MFQVLGWMALFATGYSLAAIMWYMNHRFILHGRLGDYSGFKYFKRLHSLHHIHAYDKYKNDYIVVPWWAHMFIASVSIPFFLLSTPLWLGMCLFPLVYTWRHYKIHNEDKTSSYYRMHAVHHTINPFVNYSGVHPVVDSLFGTKLDIFPLTRP